MKGKAKSKLSTFLTRSLLDYYLFGFTLRLKGERRTDIMQMVFLELGIDKNSDILNCQEEGIYSYFNLYRDIDMKREKKLPKGSLETVLFNQAVSLIGQGYLGAARQLIGEKRVNERDELNQLSQLIS